jgi:LmbE family N-acetylglucosaminyl deacetylase
MSPNTAFLSGAHPDDIEIGAGATAAKLTNLGWQLYFCILTDDLDPEIARTRRAEAIAAADALGVAEDHVIFVGLADTGLVGRGSEIDQTRAVLARHVDVDQIDIAFSHSKADVHTDHKRAHDIIQNVMKGKPILHFPIVNHLIEKDFKPEIFIEVSETHPRKLDALDKHNSQIELGRIDKREIEELSKRYGPICRSSHAEAFEWSCVFGTPRESIRLAKQLNDRRRRSHLPLTAVLLCLAALLCYAVCFWEGGWDQRGAILVEDFVGGSHISGRVTGFSSEEYADLKILVYVLTNHWYIHPWADDAPGKGFATIDPDGSWRIETVKREHRARRVAFLLTRRDAVAPHVLNVHWDPDRELLWRIRPLAVTMMSGPDEI